MEKEIINLLKKLVSYESTSENPEEIQKAVNFVYEWLIKNKIKAKKYKHKTSPYILAKVKGNIPKSILMMAHLDVVPASKKDFKLKKKGDKIFGRGVIDNKGCAVILMLLLQKIQKNNQKMPTVIVAFTSDEEIGGKIGANKISKLKELENVDGIFVPDGGEEDQIVYKAKGVLHLILKINGKSAHGSMPWLGENALDVAIEIYNKIEKIFPDLDKNNKDHWHPTVNLGMLHGGDSVNKVADNAKLGLDLRFTEKYNLEELLMKIKRIIKGKAKIVSISKGEVFSSDRNNELIKRYKQIAEKEIKKKIKLKPEHGASDARYFKKLNVPIWLHYPKGGGHHSENEWVSMKSLIRIFKILDAFLKKSVIR